MVTMARSAIFVLLLAAAPVVVDATHYEDPKNGCGADEQAVQVTGVPGDFCSPACNGTVCPKDAPSKSSAKAECALHASTGAKYCALVCTPGEDSSDACPTGATCQTAQGGGLCTYAAPAPAPPTPGTAGQWTVLDGKFSAVTIGIAFQDDKVGWTTQTTGSGLPNIVKTADGGNSWAPVTKAPKTPMPMSVTARKSPAVGVGVTGFASTVHSADGDTFSPTFLPPIPVSQDIKYNSKGLMSLSQPAGPCISKTGGLIYTCYKVPYKYGKNGRYTSAPSAEVIYHTAGTWPSKQEPHEKVHEITRNLRLVLDDSVDSPVRFELGPRAASSATSAPPTNATYVAELWKSSDGGKTWKNLIADQGNFYFNDIHCYDDAHCVAVGEGFSNDGSTQPGARVFITTDGETFNEVHRENTTGAESLMTAKMLSATEHWAGGTTKVGALLAPVLALHTKDAGKSWVNEHALVLGQMITSMDFISPTHGYATTVNALQISSLLQYGVGNSGKPAVMSLASDRQAIVV